jgi:uroporphyrinogen decarboxylase
MQAAVLGFVGSPWTLATYIIEGKSSIHYKTIKTMLYKAPTVLDALLSHLSEQIATYIGFQIKSGADCVQLFDSWGGQLPPQVSSFLSCIHNVAREFASCHVFLQPYVVIT